MRRRLLGGLGTGQYKPGNEDLYNLLVRDLVLTVPALLHVSMRNVRQ